MLREMENGITILDDILAISYKAKWLTLFGGGGGGGSKITADGDCSHELKRRLVLGRKVKDQPSSVQSLSHVRFFVIP